MNVVLKIRKRNPAGNRHTVAITIDIHTNISINKHKHKQRDSKRQKTKRNISEQSQVTESLDNGLDHSGLRHESSVSGTPAVEIIVVSSDSNTSPSASRVQNRASPIDLTVLQRKTERSVSRSPSRSKSVAKGKRIILDESRSGHAESRVSRDRSRSNGKRTRKDSHRSRSRSCSRSPSRLKESYRSIGKRQIEVHDHDMSKSELFSSKRQSLKKEKHHRENKRSRSRSRGRSRSHSKGKSASKIWSEKFNKKTLEYSRSRTASDSSMRNEALSSTRSRRSRSRRSRSERSRSRSSRSPNSRSRNSRSRSRSRSKLFSRSHSSRSPRTHVDSSRGSRSRKSTQSVDHSECNSKKLISDGDEDIKKEIEDLEHRITTDKKRLLKLLIKQEREKAVDVTEIDDETDNEPEVGDECQS